MIVLVVYINELHMAYWYKNDSSHGSWYKTIDVMNDVFNDNEYFQ